MQETWPASTIEIFRSIISAAVVVNFKVIHTKGTHLFGYIQVETETGDLKFVHDLLTDYDIAKLSTNFTHGKKTKKQNHKYNEILITKLYSP